MDYEIDRGDIHRALTLLHHREVGLDRQNIRLLKKLRATPTPIAIGQPKTIDARAGRSQVEGALPGNPTLPLSPPGWISPTTSAATTSGRLRGSVRFDDGWLCFDTNAEASLERLLEVVAAAVPGGVIVDDRTDERGSIVDESIPPAAARHSKTSTTHQPKTPSRSHVSWTHRRTSGGVAFDPHAPAPRERPPSPHACS